MSECLPRTALLRPGRSIRVSGGYNLRGAFDNPWASQPDPGRACGMRGHMWRERLAGMLLAAAIGFGLPAREAGAQVVAGSPYMSSYRVSDYFIGPGWYGTSYGFASYGFPHTYSVFTAFPGPSYG